MSETRISPQHFIAGLLRNNITDYNATARANAGLSSNFIYPDKPRLLNLSHKVQNFPRVSVTRMSLNSKGDVGMGGTETEDTVSLLINVYTIKEDIVTVRTSGPEGHTYSSGTDVYILSALPASLITTVTGTLDGVAHTFVKDTDYSINDSTGTGRYNSIDWGHDGDTTAASHSFRVTYTRVLSGVTLAEYIGHDIHIYLRDNWRDDCAPTLFDYILAREPTVISSQDERVQRCELQVQFTGINIGD